LTTSWGRETVEHQSVIKSMAIGPAVVNE